MQIYWKTTHINQELHNQSNNLTTHKKGTLFSWIQMHWSNQEHQKKETDCLYNIFQ